MIFENSAKIRMTYFNISIAVKATETKKKTPQRQKRTTKKMKLLKNKQNIMGS